MSHSAAITELLLTLTNRPHILARNPSEFHYLQRDALDNAQALILTLPYHAQDDIRGLLSGDK